MAKTMERSNKVDRWIACGIPAPIAAWCGNLTTSGKSKFYFERIERFANYSTDPEQVGSDWKAVAGAAESDDSLVSLFMLLPDGPIDQPFSAIYGRRIVDPGEERRRYAGLLECAKTINGLRKNNKLSELVSDATGTADAAERLYNFREVEGAFFDGLRKLIDVLEVIDPTAKIPTSHWASPDAAKKNYVILLAGLNRYLKEPKWKALARLANINCPACQITAEALSKAWKNGADKRT